MNTPPAGKAPLARRLEHILRGMQDDIRRLQHSTVVQVGNWRLEEHGDGLVAIHTGTQKRVVLATEENDNG